MAWSKRKVYISKYNVDWSMTYLEFGVLKSTMESEKDDSKSSTVVEATKQRSISLYVKNKLFGYSSI